MFKGHQGGYLSLSIIHAQSHQEINSFRIISWKISMKKKMEERESMSADQRCSCLGPEHSTCVLSLFYRQAVSLWTEAELLKPLISSSVRQIWETFTLQRL